MLDDLQNRRSPLTQRLANRYPRWSRVRKYAQSTGQRLLEPLGREIEQVYWWLTYDFNNYLLNTSDPFQMEQLYQLPLPSTFDFDTTDVADKRIYYAPDSVVGTLSNGSEVTLTQSENNGVEDFWYGVPTRMTAAGESYTYASTIPSPVVLSDFLLASARPRCVKISFALSIFPSASVRALLQSIIPAPVCSLRLLIKSVEICKIQPPNV